MIVVSAALVFAAVALLVVGVFWVHLLLLVYASIGVSVIAAILLGVGAFIMRDEMFGGRAARPDADGRAARPPEPTDPAAAAESEAAGGGSRPAPEAEIADGESVGDTSGPPVPDDAEVVVVPGRRTYHLASCRQLSKREKQTLTRKEALDGGRTACTACMPDTVLAVRGSSAASASPAVDDPPEELARVGASGNDITAGSAQAEAVEEETQDDPRPSAPVEAFSEDDEEQQAEAGLVGVVRGSKRYHRLTCDVVEDAVQDDIELTTMSRTEAEEAGDTPCTVCYP